MNDIDDLTMEGELNQQEWRAKLVSHELYNQLNTPEKIKIFMSRHVFAVWDFMSLLKRLQMDLTCVTIPWRPKLSAAETKYARFINEIVVGEETDSDGANGAISHFDLYLQAMNECGADVSEITNFLQKLENGEDAESTIDEINIPQSVKNFVKHTLNVALRGKTHEVCAAFFYGREDIIPDMFQVLADELESHGQSADRLLYYLKRHIELDGDEHGPLSAELLKYLCGEDETKKIEVEKAAVAALQIRINLWDGVMREIQAAESVRSIRQSAKGV